VALSCCMKATVGDVVCRGRDACKVAVGDSLKAAAGVLADSGRTSAAVVDASDGVLGLLTENDLMRAYFEAVPEDRTVAAWLKGGRARTPGHLLERLTLRPEQALEEAAERMVENVAAGNCACHHMMVREASGALRGVLSSLELAQALSCADVPGVGLGDLVGRRVEEVMKTCDEVFTCPLKYTMQQVLKVMFVTRQNSLLIAGQDGVQGIVTPRDALRAFHRGFPLTGSMADWLAQAGVAETESRLVASNVPLSDAAANMAERRLHHLVVVGPQDGAIVGVLSALDIVLSSRPGTPTKHPLLAARRTLHSPVSDFVRREDTPTCDTSCSLGDVGDLLASRNCTAAVVLDGQGCMKGVLTENDIMQAYVDGWSRADSAEHWLHSDEPQLPRHMMVRPVVPLTEVATMMLMTHAHVGSCHHVVVSSGGGSFEGILSALDIVKTLCELGSVEDAEVGMEATTVAMVAKLRLAKRQGTLATCRPTDTLADVFGALIDTGDSGIVVAKGGGNMHAVVTPRSALQAFNAGVALDSEIASMLSGEHTSIELREVAPAARLSEAVALMAAGSLHHLVVVASPGGEPIGLLSSLDVVRAAASLACSCRFVSLRWLRSCRWSAGAGLPAPAA